MPLESSFFDESSEQSKVKSAIVSKYFDAWAKVIIGAQNRLQPKHENKIAYIDLFAGPGRYNDGTKSTPLLILEKAINNPDMRNRLVTIFNDKDESNSNSLQEAINQLSRIETLKYKPRVVTNEVGEKIVKLFEQMRLIPALFFVDPWGYKGLSLRLVNSVVKDWGCDCIFFFNYNRINMGLNNPAFKEHMDALFSKGRADKLRQILEPLAAPDREILIIEELCKALKDLGARFVLPFRFKDNRGTRTSHHLIFVCKDFKGYEIMKEIMSKECSSAEQGVPSFEYNPIDAQQAFKQPFLFQLSRPLDDLSDMLLNEFAGKKLIMQEIYEQHSVDRPYIKKNYKEVLKKLESAQLITTSPHRKGSFGDNVQVSFPPQQGDKSSHER